MARHPKPPPDPEALRDLARGFVKIARDSNLTSLRAELELDGQRVEVIVERTQELVATGVDDTVAETSTLNEQVTVKVGAKTSARVLVAAPAAWLDE